MKNLLLAAAMGLFFASCSDNSSERTDGYSHSKETLSQEDSLFQAVMNGHDAAMAKMGKLSGLRKQVAEKADSLSRLKVAGQGQVQSLRGLAERMQSAENNMNTWMETFSIDSAKDDKEKRISYLQAEINTVNKIKEDILGTVAEADSVLKK